MINFSSRRTVISITLLTIVLAGIAFWLFKSDKITTNNPVIVNNLVSLTPVHSVIGKSVQGRSIDAYTFGTGKKHIVFVGGIHGGYEWNSVALAYKFLDYLSITPNIVPPNVTLTVIPSSNPDGLYRVTGKEGRFLISDVSSSQTVQESGRFNANEVDLNRNFDCKWQPKSEWKNKTVSAGTASFSEPESQAIRSFVSKNNPSAVIFWHSQGNAVYASRCENGTLPETVKIMNLYAGASGYSPVETFTAYETTGDSEAWLASIGIPAITVELKTHETVEWEENLAGVRALLEYYK
jgi:predicted deacylase